MRKLSLLALLLSAFTAQADLLTALQAHENKDFAKASTEFTQLLPLGNELAAFNLGAMAYNGEGQAVDKVKALAYFEFAAARNHNDSKALVEKLKTTLSADEQHKADALLEQLQQQVKIDRAVQQDLRPESEKNRKGLKRVAPVFPKEAAEHGAFGSVTLRMLVNEAGDVEAVDVLNAFPKGVFEKSAMNALKKWKYEPGNAKFIGKVVIQFNIGEIDARKMRRLFDDNKLWQYSAMGSPVHQNAIANVLHVARSHSAYTQFVDKSLPPVLGEVTSDFVAQPKPLNADLTLPQGYDLDAFVTVDAQGKVTAVHDSNVKRKAKLTASLVGHQLTTDKIDAGFYRLDMNYFKKGPRLLPAQRIPETLTDYFWLEKAARGGNLEAQRALAAYRPDWEKYLLEQQDPVVQSWAGTRLILDGKKAEGEKLLDAAIAKGHVAAKELKAAL